MLPLANRPQTSSICSRFAWSQYAETIQISSGVNREAMHRLQSAPQSAPHK